MFNINGWELIVIGVLFILLFGPDRLPEVAGQIGRLLRDVRRMTEGATAELTRELELAARDMQDVPAPPAPREAAATQPHRAEGTAAAQAAPSAGPARLGDGPDHASRVSDRPPPAPSIFRPLTAAGPEREGVDPGDPAAGAAPTAGADDEVTHPSDAGAQE